MEITLEFVGPVRRPSGVDGVAVLALAEGACVDDALSKLGYTDSERRLLRVLRRGETAPRGTPLAAGDRLTVFLLLGGG
jgi:molybdopterin converting factor small subunit